MESKPISNETIKELRKSFRKYKKNSMESYRAILVQQKMWLEAELRMINGRIEWCDNNIGGKENGE